VEYIDKMITAPNVAYTHKYDMLTGDIKPKANHNTNHNPKIVDLSTGDVASWHVQYVVIS